MPKFCPCADCCNGVMLRQPTGDMTDMYVIELHNRHLMEKRKAESARAYLDVVNAPPEGALQQGTSTEAPTGSQDAPSGQIYLYTYQKWNQDLLDALSKGPLLETCRHELELGGHSCVLPDSGASVFVRLDQWHAVMEKIAGIVLKKHHVIVADEFDHLLHSTVNQIRSRLRPRVKTRTALEIACPEAHYHMEVAEAPWGTPNPTPIPTPTPTPSSSPNRELPPSQGPRRSRGLTAQEQQIHFAGALAAYEKAAYEKTYDKTYAGAYAKASAQAYAKACGRLRSPTFAYAKACGRKTQS